MPGREGASNLSAIQGKRPAWLTDPKASSKIELHRVIKRANEAFKKPVVLQSVEGAITDKVVSNLSGVLLALDCRRVAFHDQLY